MMLRCYILTLLNRIQHRLHRSQVLFLKCTSFIKIPSVVSELLLKLKQIIKMKCIKEQGEIYIHVVYCILIYGFENVCI